MTEQKPSRKLIPVLSLVSQLASSSIVLYSALKWDLLSVQLFPLTSFCCLGIKHFSSLFGATE